MADAQVLGTCGAIREGSTPSVPTNTRAQYRVVLRFLHSFLPEGYDHAFRFN